MKVLIILQIYENSCKEKIQDPEGSEKLILGISTPPQKKGIKPMQCFEILFSSPVLHPIVLEQ